MDTNEQQHERESHTDPMTDRVLERIQKEHVTPRPRWEFLARNRAMWGIALLAIIIASGAAAATIFVLANAGWQYAPATHGSLFALLLASAPIVWMVAVIVSLGVGYWNIRHTVHGYRYPLPLLAAGLVLISLLAGAALFATGIGQEVEEGIGQHVPFYRPLLDEEQSWWMNTARGLLVGNVVSIAPDFSSFDLRTHSGTIWHVDASDLRAYDIGVLARGGTVRVVGVPYVASSTGPFHACFVFPWEVYGSFGRPHVSLPVAAFTASTSEIIPTGARSSLCKGVRPYQSLRALEQHD